MLGTPFVRFATLLTAPAEAWRAVCAEHPFGERFRG
jgi:hypothetical protein